MGKYMRKSKTTTEVALIDVVSPSSSSSSICAGGGGGVRTRARTLALQQRRLQTAGSSPPSPPPAPSSPSVYLQLRSRRLFKSLISAPDSKKPKSIIMSQQQQQHHGVVSGGRNPNPSPKSDNSGNSAKGGGGINFQDCNDDGVAAVEGSFGENVLDSEARGRSTRESTPCSLIRKADSIRTPGSTTRHVSASEATRRSESSTRRLIPTTQEMEEFFAGLEEEQRKQFIEKYNFDPMNDKPLPGRYEWEVLEP